MISGDANDKRIKIYTRTGDKGKTSNFAGQRLPKDDAIFEALGNNDELSSSIGLAREYCKDGHLISKMLQEIQCVLQDIGSHIATPRTASTRTKLEQTEFNKKHVENLENWIDELDKELPPLKNFILPSGGKGSAHIHVARTICRRTERRIVPLFRDGHVEETVAMYLNRLSDFLFTAARYTAQCEGKQEIVYKRTE